MSLYLVTGGAGFIGSHLVSALVARGDRARVLDDLSSGDRTNLAHLECGGPGSGAPVELFVGDLGTPGLAEAACQGVAGVLHHAAQVSVPQSFDDPRRSYEINVLGTLGLLEAARQAGVERFVLAGSSAAYGDPDELPAREDQAPAPRSPYASGKLAAEGLVRVWASEYGLRAASLRYFNVYGPRQSDGSPYSGVIAILARALAEGGDVTFFGDGTQSRDFVYVDDVVRVNLLALAADLEPGEVFNVGTGREVTLNALYEVMRDLAGTGAPPRYGPLRAGDVHRSCASIERACERLGYRPEVALRDGLRATLDWYHTCAER